MAKRTVRYIQGSLLMEPRIGGGAFVRPLDHPDGENVSNTQHVYTSNVVAYDPATGVIETANSRYVPAEVN